jgi:hypothetical protein
LIARGGTMKRLFRFYKKADKQMNRILIPKIIIAKLGREFYLDLMENDTLVLTPVSKEKKESEK